MSGEQPCELLRRLNCENALKREQLTRLQSELAGFGQSTVMVAMEPDTTVFSEDTEVSMEMDPTVQRFRCKQLRAELDILALKDLKKLPDDNQVRYAALKSDLQRLASELRECVVFYRQQQTELQNDIEREKKTSRELEATVSAAERRLAETGQRQESKKQVHSRLQDRCKKLEAANKNKIKQMTKFIEKFYPLPSLETYKKVNKKVEGQSGQRLSPHKDLLPLNTIVEMLISQTLDQPNDPYIDIDGTFWPPYIELLLQCDIALRHPSNSKRIKLMPFHL